MDVLSGIRSKYIHVIIVTSKHTGCTADTNKDPPVEEKRVTCF